MYTGLLVYTNAYSILVFTDVYSSDVYGCMIMLCSNDICNYSWSILCSNQA